MNAYTTMQQMLEMADDVRRAFGEGDPGGLYPPVDIRATEAEVVLVAELPGASRDDLVIEVEGRHLTLRGEKPGPAEAADATPVHRERRYGKFERTFELNFEVNREAIAADFRDGVLTVRLPKMEAARPRRIEVTGG
ncbi:MAG: Hsp20/alpha crystallin family protein [Fimbriimonadaceae bacterium]|nr:Hsp20/alpha crystallin family protein [Fimbriimonadaceae bacterium]